MSAFLKFLRARLSPQGLFGLHLTIGALSLIAAAAIFSVIAGQVVAGAPLTIRDVQIAQWLHQHATPGWTEFILVITHLNGITAIILWAIVMGIHLVRNREWYWLLSTTIAVAGGMLLNVALKYTFQRARPSFEEPLLTLSTYSFPSGHTAASTVFYGVLAAYLCSRVTAKLTQLAIIMAAATMVLLVGFSRMYLGVHYFTDVVAAIAEGCAWLALTLTAVATLRRRTCLRANRTANVA
ncbi:MAG: phosphatase PAP2 family protein [Pseudomonadota bacterium]